MPSDQLQITQLAARLGELLLAQQAVVTTAESCTGGGIAEAITRIAGSSAWFEAGWVTYSNEQKQALLAVPEQALVSYGAVSEPVAKAMAEGALVRAQAELSVAVSGIAGPGGGTPQKPVGTVCFAWCKGAISYTRTYVFAGDRQQVRAYTVQTALKGLIQLLETDKLLD